MARNQILIALESVGIDPLGHDRPESVYGGSRLLFPHGARGEVLDLCDAPIRGILVETDVIGGAEQGAIECAITYTSIFSGGVSLERLTYPLAEGATPTAVGQLSGGGGLRRPNRTGDSATAGRPGPRGP